MEDFRWRKTGQEEEKKDSERLKSAPAPEQDEEREPGEQDRPQSGNYPDYNYDEYDSYSPWG